MSLSDNLSDDGKLNLTTLVGLLKTRLASEEKTKQLDKDSNVVWVDVNIFATEALENFLFLALSEFNMIPRFTYFTFEDSGFVNIFAEVLVEGAVIQALAARSLIEKGREFMVQDNGIAFNPPSVADIMQTQYATLLIHHLDKLKIIKDDIDNFDEE